MKISGMTNRDIANKTGIGLRSVQKYTAHLRPSKIKIPNKITKEKAIIHGFLSAEGYTHTTKELTGVTLKKMGKKYEYVRTHLKKPRIKVSLVFTNYQKELNENFVKSMETAYGYTPSKEKKFAMVIHPKKIVEDILKISPIGSRKWYVPRSIAKNKLLSKCWLRAFFDGEATVYYDKKHRKKEIRLDSVNGDSLKNVSKMLENFSIKNSFRGPYSDERFRLTISRKENLTKYKRFIGFWHPKKIALLEKSIQG